MTKRVLSLCDLSGVMVAPWVEAGFRATIVDLQHPKGTTTTGPLSRVGADIMDYEPDGDYDMIFAFPPLHRPGRIRRPVVQAEGPGRVD